MGIDLTKLKELAERATPGPWTLYVPENYQGPEELPGYGVECAEGRAIIWGALEPETGCQFDRDAEFIAAANPQAILGLIAEVERLRGEVATYEDGMRSLASQLGAGGFNAEKLTAAQLVDKVQWGADNLAETQGHMLDEIRTVSAALRKDSVRYRELRKITPHRFKKLQEAATTDGGDVFYFHADRFDAALDAAMEGGGR